MKKLTLILSVILAGTTLLAQQIPISENYYLDKYSFSPSYAGNFNTKFLFAGYRSDWSGITGGPKTFRLSFNDAVGQNMGLGGKIIFDKAGIFDQLYVLGSYAYNLKIHEYNNLMFGLSAGIYRNSLNFTEYYNDPNYNIDPALISQDINSKLKFMSDFSLVWAFQGFEAGAMFSNINFGDSQYDEVDVKYTPLANYQVHASYYWNIAENWDMVPIVILRGGKYIRSQFEIASQVLYVKRVWGSVAFRDPGVWGVGIGANIDKGIKLGYNFNFASKVALNVFNNHEFILGFNIFEYVVKR